MVDLPLPPRLSLPQRRELAALRWRRRLFAGLVLATLLTAVGAMARLLGGDGFGPGDAVLLLCFAAMLPWNVIGFWNAVIGLVILHRHADPAGLVTPAASAAAGNAPIRIRTAVVMPVHDEDPARVLRHLESTAASLEATGEGGRFALFLLSDTQDPTLAAEEEARFAAWRRRARHPERLHYRRRADNAGHKPGNLQHFLDEHGARFDLMLVLDADSVMSGEAILRLVRIMQVHPEIGILQQLIVGLPNPSPFARLFQFGMRHGMRAHTVGAAWWQGDCGPYWGHNAVIRIAPFMAHCRLPPLPGGPPLGGRILSHDQVEAVLMRRAGWQVRVLPLEEGSFEENPPTLLDFIRRDLRWCQGNWQYLRLIGRPGLHRMGRLQLGLAILMYVSGPAAVLFALVGFARAILDGSGTGEPPGAALLGRPAGWEGWALLAAMAGIVFAPKLAGLAQALASRRLRRAYGGGPRLLASALAEFLFSLVLAPIMAVAQARFVLGLAMGRRVSWQAQQRDPHRVRWREALSGLWPQSVLGLGLGAAVVLLASGQVWPWAALFCGPLLLAVPFACATSRPSWGRRLVRLGLAAVPEEHAPPAVVVAAGHALHRAPVPTMAAGGAAGSVAAEVPAAPAVD